MKINYITDTLHTLYKRAKHGFLVVFCLSFIVLVSMSQQARGEGVVGSVDTKVNYTAAGKTTTFVTQENTIANALLRQGIKLEKNDTTEPSLGTPLIGGEVSARLIPALPVLINDNGQYWVGKSSYSDTLDILNQLEVKVDKVDRVSKELILDPVTENMAGQQITIERAPVFTVSVDDTEVFVHSWNQTVAEVLTDGGVMLNQNDTVSPEKETVAPTSGQITVTRVNFADVEEMVAIPYSTQNQNSYEVYKNQTKVTQEGRNGSKKQSVHIVYHNGVEISREITGTTVVESPQTKIVLVGQKPYNAGMWWETIVAAGQKYGVDPVAMYTVMICESGGNPYAGTTYKGLFQWDGSFYTWAAKAGYPGAVITDGNAQIYATALRVSKNGWSAWGCKP